MRNFILLCCITAALLSGGCVSQRHADGYNSATDFNPVEAAKTRISLGLTYLKNGNYKQAKFNLDKALDYAPRLAEAHYSIGYYYQLVGENQQADEAYQRALSLSPENADIANSYGAFLCQQGDYPRAKRYFLQAVNSEQYNAAAETYENLALCSQTQGMTDDAINYLQTALKHQPSRAKALFLLAQLQASDERWEEARETVRRYESIANVSPEVLWLLIKVEQALGNESAAKGYGKILVDMYPSHPNTASYLKATARHKTPQNEVPQNNLEQTQPEPSESEPSKPEPTKVVQIEAVDTRPVAIKMAEEGSTQEAENAPEPEEQPQPRPGQSTHEVADQASQPKIHVVQQGENLYRISLKYNIRIPKLLEWNNLDSETSIQAGQTLYLVDPTQIPSTTE